MDSIFIPKKIRVGYQNRDDTYTKKLAYVIYYDAKGVLRKEKSWEDWRDKDIPFEEFDNIPQSGFVINKDISRYNWGHFGSNRSYIRMYDPRGIEFEITPENLIGILMNSNCLRKGLEGEFIYAWVGKELVLLPVCSEEYRQAVEYTSLQDKSIKSKNLILGASYKDKKGDDWIYIGKFNHYLLKRNYEKDGYERCKNKHHIFISPDQILSKDIQYIYKDSINFLSTCTNENPVENYSSIVDQLKNKDSFNEIVEFKESENYNSVSIDINNIKDNNYYSKNILSVNNDDSHYFFEYDAETKTIKKWAICCVFDTPMHHYYYQNVDCNKFIGFAMILNSVISTDFIECVSGGSTGNRFMISKNEIYHYTPYIE